MKKTKAELVTLFYEDGEPIGMLVDDGKRREIYLVKRATKEHVAILLETGKEDEVMPF